MIKRLRVVFRQERCEDKILECPIEASDDILGQIRVAVTTRQNEFQSLNVFRDPGWLRSFFYEELGGHEDQASKWRIIEVNWLIKAICRGKWLAIILAGYNYDHSDSQVHGFFYRYDNAVFTSVPVPRDLLIDRDGNITGTNEDILLPINDEFWPEIITDFQLYRSYAYQQWLLAKGGDNPLTGLFRGLGGSDEVLLNLLKKHLEKTLHAERDMLTHCQASFK